VKKNKIKVNLYKREKYSITFLEHFFGQVAFSHFGCKDISDKLQPVASLPELFNLAH
jgi:hypothetical protein